MPFLVPLELIGILAHAWSRWTAQVLLRDLGFGEQIVGRPVRRNDMAGFLVWLRTASPSRIPGRCLLFIKEPRHMCVA